MIVDGSISCTVSKTVWGWCDGPSNYGTDGERKENKKSKGDGMNVEVMK